MPDEGWLFQRAVGAVLSCWTCFPWPVGWLYQNAGRTSVSGLKFVDRYHLGQGLNGLTESNVCFSAAFFAFAFGRPKVMAN